MAGAVWRADIELPVLGGNIRLKIRAGNVNVEEIRRVTGYFAIGATTTLAVLYDHTVLRPFLVDVIHAVFDHDQQIDIRPGCLHVDLHCLTDERFLEVLEDYESGEIKERLQKEFTEVGIKVEGLKVAIDNMEEVNQIKAAINKRYWYLCRSAQAYIEVSSS